MSRFRIVTSTAGGLLLLHFPELADLPFGHLGVDGSNVREISLVGLYAPATTTFYELDLAT